MSAAPEVDAPPTSLHLRRSEAEAWLDAAYGTRRGQVAVAFGIDPYRNARGGYRHRDWTPRTYAWPAQRNALLTDVAGLLADADNGGPTVDTYVCPHLRKDRKRRAGGALPPTALHADLDGPPADPDLWSLLDPVRVASGTAGHEHGLVLLAEPLHDLGRWEQLQEALRDRLGADAKITDNDVLRLPGTINGKPTAPLPGEPAGPAVPVTLLPGGGRVWSLDELATLLGVDLAQPAPPPRRRSGSGGSPPLTVVPVPEPLAHPVAEALDILADACERGEDRSSRWDAVIVRCAWAGYSRDQAHAVALGAAVPIIERFADRHTGDGVTDRYRARPDMFARSWSRGVELRNTAQEERFGATTDDLRDRLVETGAEFYAELVEECGAFDARRVWRALRGDVIAASLGLTIAAADTRPTARHEPEHATAPAGSTTTPDRPRADEDDPAVTDIAEARRRRGQSRSAGPAANQRPSVVVNGRDLAEMTNQTRRFLVAAAARDTSIFRYGGEIAIRGEGAHVQLLDKWLLAEELAKRIRFQTVTDKKTAAASPPHEVVAALHSGRGLLDLPRLDRVSMVPFFTPDGRWWTTPGYCAAARTLYVPDPSVMVPDVPERPSAAEVTAARELILTESLGDFPFETDGDRAAAVALMLLPVVRSMIDGPTPLHGIDAPTRGNGKGLLARVCLSPALGTARPEIAQAERNDEWPKIIVAALRTGAPVMWLDNLDRPLSSASVAVALTAWPSFTGRILGSSTMADLPAPGVWCATANNLRASSEIARRTVRIRIDSRHERPEERTGFRHPHLERWVLDHRGELIAACATLVRAWQTAGAPPGRGVLGSFQRWLEVVGGVLANAGIDGLLTNRTEWLTTADGEDIAWRAVVQVWAAAIAAKPGRAEMTAGQLLGVLDGADLDLPFDLPGHFSAKQRVSVVGKALAAQRGRRFGEWVIERRPTVSAGRVMWRLGR